LQDGALGALTPSAAGASKFSLLNKRKYLLFINKKRAKFLSLNFVNKIHKVYDARCRYLTDFKYVKLSLIQLCHLCSTKEYP
jgi:hypothetical protein